MSELSVISVPTEEWKELKAIVASINQKVTNLTEKDQNELMTIPEVLERLKVGRTSIRRYVDEGLLSVQRLNNNPRGKMYIKRSEVEERLNSGIIG